jgi:hypothetical protein
MGYVGVMSYETTIYHVDNYDFEANGSLYSFSKAVAANGGKPEGIRKHTTHNGGYYFSKDHGPKVCTGTQRCFGRVVGKWEACA